jgi:aspartate kinase
MRQEPVVVGISSEPSVVPLRLSGVPEAPASIERILQELARANVDLRSIARTEGRSYALLIAAAHVQALAPVLARLRAEGIVGEADLGSTATPVAVIGSRLTARLSIAARMFRALSREAINSEWLSTSDARIWCLVGDADRHRALAALHDEFADELGPLREGLNHTI